MDQDTFRLALVAWARVGGDNPSGAKKEESMLRRRQEEGAGEYKIWRKSVGEMKRLDI